MGEAFEGVDGSESSLEVVGAGAVELIDRTGKSLRSLS